MALHVIKARASEVWAFIEVNAQIRHGVGCTLVRAVTSQDAGEADVAGGTRTWLSPCPHSAGRHFGHRSRCQNLAIVFSVSRANQVRVNRSSTRAHRPGQTRQMLFSSSVALSVGGFARERVRVGHSSAVLPAEPRRLCARMASQRRLPTAGVLLRTLGRCRPRAQQRWKAWPNPEGTHFLEAMHRGVPLLDPADRGRANYTMKIFTERGDSFTTTTE